MMATVIHNDSTVFEFRVLLQGHSEVTESLSEAIYATCDDALLVSRNGKTFVIFDREAASFGSAVKSAIDDLERAGMQVVAVRRL